MRCMFCFMVVAAVVLVAGCGDEPTRSFPVRWSASRERSAPARSARRSSQVRAPLLSVGGDLGGFKVGDRVCVKGKFAEVSYCMAGEGTIAVEAIGPEASARDRALVGHRRRRRHAVNRSESGVMGSSGGSTPSTGVSGPEHALRIARQVEIRRQVARPRLRACARHDARVFQLVAVLERREQLARLIERCVGEERRAIRGRGAAAVACAAGRLGRSPSADCAATRSAHRSTPGSSPSPCPRHAA